MVAGPIARSAARNCLPGSRRPTPAWRLQPFALAALRLFHARIRKRRVSGSDIAGGRSARAVVALSERLATNRNAGQRIGVMLLRSHLILRPVGLVRGWAGRATACSVPPRHGGEAAEPMRPIGDAARSRFAQNPHERGPTGRAVPEWTRDCDLTRWMNSGRSCSHAHGPVEIRRRMLSVSLGQARHKRSGRTHELGIPHHRRWRIRRRDGRHRLGHCPCGSLGSPSMLARRFGGLLCTAGALAGVTEAREEDSPRRRGLA